MDVTSMRDASLSANDLASRVKHAAPSSDGVLFGSDDGSKPEFSGLDPQRIKQRSLQATGMERAIRTDHLL